MRLGWASVGSSQAAGIGLGLNSFLLWDVPRPTRNLPALRKLCIPATPDWLFGEPLWLRSLFAPLPAGGPRHRREPLWVSVVASETWAYRQTLL